MNLKTSILILICLFGWLSTTHAKADYENESGDQESSQMKDISSADEIYDSSALQQEMEASDRKYDTLNSMDMDTETEVSQKSVRNISDNELSKEYSSIEHEDDESNDEEVVEEEDENTSIIQSTEQNSNDSKMAKDESEIEDSLSKKSRMGRLLTTTTVPDYIRTKTKSSDEQNLTKEDVNLSSSDYMEDEQDLNHHHDMLRKENSNPLVAHEENEDIVPLAMKYYDDIPQDNISLSLEAKEEVAAAQDRSENGEDLKSVNKLQNNEPVLMPQQQLLPHQRQQHSKHLQQQNISSEEYYEDEEYHEEESSSTTTTTPTPDTNIIRALFGGFPFNYNPSTTAPNTATASPFPTTLSYHPINEQFDSSLVTTSAPPLSPNTLVMGLTTTSRIAPAAAAAAAAAASVTGDKKGKQIPILSTTTAAAAPSRRRLLPHEQLRNYIEDAYIRMPLAVIVDPSAESLEKTKALWNDAMRTNLNIKIVLVTLNESEESPASFNFNNTRQFLTGLNSIKEQTSGDTFRGISHAAELVPYDSAVFISTAELADHTDQVQDSAITLLKKRIRLYLIWFGERSLSENETQDSIGGILGEVAIRSGGEVLHIVGSENSQELEGSTLTIVADALRGSQEVDVPVDTTLSSLHVKIDKLMRRAVLETPNGG